MSPITSQVVPANGIAQHLLRRGGNGLPLLLLHGWPEWSHVWRRLMGELDPSYDLVAPDFRGFGATQKTALDPSPEATPDQLADDLLALADALGLKRFGIVAHDVGAFVAQALARRAPRRLHGLFFFNCPYPGIGARWVAPDHLTNTWYQYFHQQPWAAELIGSSPAACRIYLRRMLAHWAYREDTFDAELEAWVANFMQPGNLQGGFNWYLSIHAARLAMIEGRSAAPALIATPTRVYWGEHDPVLKVQWMDRLGEFFSDVQASAAADAGHFVHYEQPQAAAREVQRFFAALLAR